MENTIKGEALKHLPDSKKLRKRFLVSEGDLFQLYKEMQQVRGTECREKFTKDFRQLLADAQLIKLTVVPKD